MILSQKKTCYELMATRLIVETGQDEKRLMSHEPSFQNRQVCNNTVQ